MAGMFSEDLKRRIREANDLADVIRSYGIELKRAGRNLKACCPFHHEKSASFNVNPEGQYFKCFGCGKGGDVFTFVKDFERVEFPEAVRILAQRASIPIEFDPTVVAKQKKEGDFKSYLYKLNAAAAAFYREMLMGPQGKAAREYLDRRGIDEEMRDTFGLGYAPATGSPLMQRLQAQKAPLRALEVAGLASSREDGSAYDYFRDRVMFPIADSQGRVIGFGGRVLGDGEPKYLNTRETPLFSKGRTIYGLAQARDAIVEARKAAIVEGYTDVIMCHQYGVRNVVACLGTAITPEHVRSLRRLADEVLLLTDSDAAGARASERGIEILFQEDMAAKVVRLPGDDKDPCDFLRSAGKGPFEEALGRGVDLFEYKVKRVCQAQDVSTVRGQAAAAKELMALASISPDANKRAAYRREISALLNLPEKDLAFEKAARAPEAGSAPAAGDEVPPPEHPLAHVEREMLRWIFHQPAWIETATGQLDFTAFVGGPEGAIAMAILAGLADGQLPPDPAKLGLEGYSPSGAVAREVLGTLAAQTDGASGDEQPNPVYSAAQALCIALAEEAPMHVKMKPEEAYGLRVRAVSKERVDFDMEAAKRAEAAARALGDEAALAAAQQKMLDLLMVQKEMKRGKSARSVVA
ncbi:MAG: DNA primase [Planctomycetota bacterium]|nr:DNA primase [Planctomycetota bacterium]